MRKSSPQITSARHVDTLTGLPPVEIKPEMDSTRAKTVKLKPVSVAPESVAPEKDGLKLEPPKKRSTKDDSGRYSFVYVPGNTDVVSAKKR